MDDALLTCLEAARFLNVRPATIRTWTSRRMIASVRVGSRAVRYRRSDLERMIRQGSRPALRPLHVPENHGGENGGGEQ